MSRIPKRVTVHDADYGARAITLDDGREILVMPGLIYDTEIRPYISNPVTAHIEDDRLIPGDGFIKFEKVASGVYAIIEED